ncbi:MAG: hypothetical protein Terrestrivirus9_30 [Terrestrivirus sp.]|uniref:Uncharacterized protein n=1 Tax=Terrestrivirus sp. TaxID=2487775 RepID=A0A3G4ZSL6_9VIRU|nr:MAG: hypothetical protein Terrestrivirus9_30 [Terrestrivirus sp.]
MSLNKNTNEWILVERKKYKPKQNIESETKSETKSEIKSIKKSQKPNLRIIVPTELKHDWLSPTGPWSPKCKDCGTCDCFGNGVADYWNVKIINNNKKIFTCKKCCIEYDLNCELTSFENNSTIRCSKCNRKTNYYDIQYKINRNNPISCTECK